MKVLAIDPALNNTGWAVLEGGTDDFPWLKGVGRIRFSTKKHGSQSRRLWKLYRELCDVYRVHGGYGDEKKFRAAVVAERGFRGVLSDVRGVLRMFSEVQTSADAILYTPAAWQSLIGAHKKEYKKAYPQMKDRVGHLVNQHFGDGEYTSIVLGDLRETCSQDEIDAIGIGMAHFQKLRYDAAEDK